MDANIAQGGSAARAEQLAQRVRAAQLPPPDERARIRRDAHVALREMAAALGVTPAAVLRWEAGTSTPRTDHAIAYRQLLDAIQDATTEGSVST